MYIEFMIWPLLFVVDFSVSDRTATTTKHSAEKGANPTMVAGQKITVYISMLPK